MEKTGEVREGITPCDICGQPATTIVDKQAWCDKHKVEGKIASADIGLKSFTAPLCPK